MLFSVTTGKRHKEPQPRLMQEPHFWGPNIVHNTAHVDPASSMESQSLNFEQISPTLLSVAC
jgi:hypothetical protein